jgi:hypothetical protein
VKGKDVELEPMSERPRAEVVDLMERLRRSVEKSDARPRSGQDSRLRSGQGQRPAKAAAADKASPGLARAQSRARRKKPAARKRSRRAA